MFKKNEIRTSLTPYTEINSKWIKDLKRPDIIKTLVENQAEHSDINSSSIFFKPSPRAMEIKTKINK